VILPVPAAESIYRRLYLLIPIISIGNYLLFVSAKWGIPFNVVQDIAGKKIWIIAAVFYTAPTFWNLQRKF